MADADKRFDSRATLRPTQEPGEGKDDLTFEVRGEARIQSGNMAQMTLEAVMKGAYVPVSAVGGGNAWFSLETTLALETGKYIVLGSSPGSTAEGDAIALAVRVTHGNGIDE